MLGQQINWAPQMWLPTCTQIFIITSF